MDVLKLIYEEFTISEIAEKLNIKTSTISFHRRNLLSKLAVRNTAGLIKESINLGLIK